jgi:iron(III) transport system substrate-binding protein
MICLVNKLLKSLSPSISFVTSMRLRPVCLMVITSGILMACADQQEPLVATPKNGVQIVEETGTKASEIIENQATIAPDRLVVYSSRNEHLISPVFKLFTDQTGIEIEYATDKAGVLIERIKMEGANTPADVLITVDAGTLGLAASQGLFQPINSSVINQRVPAYLRDDNDFWTGLSLRARTIVYSTERVKPEQLSTYSALGGDQWQDKLCLRTSKKVYNQSLVAMLIASQGEAQAQATVVSWIDNLAIAPTSNDTKVMQAILAGQCDVGIVNTYYFGRLQTKSPALALALFWPNESGVHVNVAGAGLLKNSKNAIKAKSLLEWLVSEAAQELFAGVNQEYPVSTDVKLDPQVASWGQFRQSQQPLSQAYILQPNAVKLMDRAGYK